MPKEMSPSRSSILVCEKCERTFSTALSKRRVCLDCKSLDKEETSKLMNYEGAHVVLCKGDSFKSLIV